ncbi:TorF family putative porin [Phenylobacterium sp.]|uniref:TorF family putative porin n=1 Tax=Phenylobacterium sp. TaxID=1871053 RepID=UPI002ED96BC9
MNTPSASGVALALAIAALPATTRAQVSGGVTLASDYRVRGVSLTDGRGVAVASLAYDHESGVYAGGSIVAHDPAERDVRLLGWQGYAGVSGRLRTGSSWDVGVTRVDMEPYFDRRYSLEYTQVHVGLAHGDVSGRLSVASGYPRKGVETAYAELNAALRPADGWRLIGHVGLQSRLTERRGDDDERLDVTVGVARSFGKRAEALLSWTVLTPRPEPRVTWTRPGLTAALTVYF